MRCYEEIALFIRNALSYLVRLSANLRALLKLGSQLFLGYRVLGDP